MLWDETHFSLGHPPYLKITHANLRETDHLFFVSRAFSGECTEGLAHNLACWCILVTFNIFWILFDFPFWFCETVQICGFWAFLKNAWEEWPEIWHADVSWTLSELIFWSWSVELLHFLSCWLRGSVSIWLAFGDWQVSQLFCFLI